MCLIQDFVGACLDSRTSVKSGHERERGTEERLREERPEEGRNQRDKNGMHIQPKFSN